MDYTSERGLEEGLLRFRLVPGSTHDSSGRRYYSCADEDKYRKGFNRYAYYNKLRGWSANARDLFRRLAGHASGGSPLGYPYASGTGSNVKLPSTEGWYDFGNLPEPHHGSIDGKQSDFGPYDPNQPTPHGLGQLFRDFGYNYLGPDTDLEYNHAHNVKPVNELDRLAMVHDNAYRDIENEFKHGRLSYEDAAVAVAEADAALGRGAGSALRYDDVSPFLTAIGMTGKQFIDSFLGPSFIDLTGAMQTGHVNDNNGVGVLPPVSVMPNKPYVGLPPGAPKFGIFSTTTGLLDNSLGKSATRTGYGYDSISFGSRKRKRFHFGIKRYSRNRR